MLGQLGFDRRFDIWHGPQVKIRRMHVVYRCDALKRLARFLQRQNRILKIGIRRIAGNRLHFFHFLRHRGLKRRFKIVGIY